MLIPEFTVSEGGHSGQTEGSGSTPSNEHTVPSLPLTEWELYKKQNDQKLRLRDNSRPLAPRTRVPQE